MGIQRDSTGLYINVQDNPLSYASINTYIPAMQAKGVEVKFENRTPTTLEKISSVTVSIAPSPIQSPAPGERLVLNLNITDGEDVAGYQATLQFDATALRYISSRNADYLPVGAFVIPPLAGENQVTLAATSLNEGSHGSGTLATITFEVIDVKTSALTLSDVKLTNIDADFLRVVAENAKVVE